MMKISDLFEAPISDFHHVGDFNRNSGFRDQDRKLITNPKALRKIQKLWKYPEDVDFNIIYVNHPDGNAQTEIGEVDRNWITSKMPRIADELLPLLKEDEANIIFTNNKASPREPMTGWIQAHRVGHVLFRDRIGGKYSYYEEAFKYFSNTVIDILKNSYHINVRGFERLGPTLSFIKAVATFKSAREKTLRDSYEALHESVAQYMLTGKVTFNDLPKTFKHGHKYYRFDNSDDSYDYINLGMKECGEVMEDYFETSLYHAVGKIYVM